MDELIASLYALSFESLTYDNQEEVLNFIKARVDKMMGSTAKRYQQLFPRSNEVHEKRNPRLAVLYCHGMASWFTI